ncbi:asparagine synthase (glutamine-hydrolyzing) [Planctomycetota bacterium]
MCGITGLVSFDGALVSREVIERMTRTLVHRGPDDEGFYVDSIAGLGMRRLQVIDLDGGRQPISNEDGTVHVVFNGEIYNYGELRRAFESQGHVFRTHSDTETIVHAYEEAGLDFPKQLNGMFAIALWDRPRRRLVLARDRLGIKPLYYTADATRIAFGSEAKAVLASGYVRPEVDPEALQAYAALRYIPAPLTIFKGIRKLPAGHLLVFDERGVREVCYWDVDFHPKVTLSPAQCFERFDELFLDAVRMRMISDVPLGAFLSGGVDSSGIVAFMTRVSSTPPKTFSIGFEERSYDERQYARTVANHLRTAHEESLAEPDLLRFLPDYVYHFDEPFADPAALPTFLLSQHARRHVTVALSGDGGDEIFAGYQRYYSEMLADRFARIPSPIRRWLTDTALPLSASLIPVRRRLRRSADDVVKKAQLAGLPPVERYLAHFNAFYGFSRQSIWSPSMLEATVGIDPYRHIAPFMRRGERLDPLSQRQYTDIKTWLPEQMLTKVDRMSMAVSLEVRVPFLDHRLVELAAAVPARERMDWWSLKKFLRRAMSKHLPRQIAQRRKHGFQVPLDRWFRTDLREMACDTLTRRRLEDHGFFHPDLADTMISDHLSGRRNHGERLLSLLVFTMWYERWVRGPICPNPHAG